MLPSKSKQHNRTTIIINYILLALVALFWLSPFTWLVFASIDPNATSAFKLPSKVTFEHFLLVFVGSSSAHWIVNSLIISAGSATLILAVTMFAAYPFSRLNFRWKNIVLWGLVLIRIIPLSAFLLPLFILCVKLGLLNLVGVIIALSMLNIPFGLLLIKNFYDTIPVTYEEAAWVDGAGIMGTIFKILFPIARPGAVVIWFMTFTGAWNEFMLPFVLLRNPDFWPMSVGLYNSFGLHGNVNFGFLSAFSVIYALPSIMVFFFLRKNLVSGLAGAGIKG